MSSTNNYIVNGNDNFKRSMYLVKELLKDKKDLNVKAGVRGSNISAKVCNTLVNLNYVTYSNIFTETAVVDGRRRTSLVITIVKSDQFDKLYAENEEKRKQFKEKRENEKKNTTEK